MSFNSTGSTMCNSRDVRIAAIALQEADRSTMKYHQHGCVAVANGQIIARGTNSYRCQSNDGYLTDTCSCHAEIDVLRKLELTKCRVKDYTTPHTSQGNRFLDRGMINREYVVKK